MPSASKSSSKKKQKEQSEVVEAEATLSVDTPLSLLDEHAALLKAQKRVLPSRTRRGGAGVGSCDIDLTIIDAQRRAEENKPLVPIHFPFLLVTDASMAPRLESPEPSTSAQDQTIDAPSAFYQSYFDRPEVIRSFREQELIETPIFGPLPEDAVGGRLRTRSNEEDMIDTSDSAYMQRHRKFETFEKRQRRREKEKLEHEHHKLKNRIEQLKSLDALAFGGKDLIESEKRRETMLSTALDLEERYRILLPEPRHRAVVTSRAKPQLEVDDEDDEEPRPEAVNNTRSGRLTIKIKRTPPTTADAGSPLADDEGPGSGHFRHPLHKKVFAKSSKKSYKKKKPRPKSSILHRKDKLAPSTETATIPADALPSLVEPEALVNGNTEPQQTGEDGEVRDEEEAAVAASVIPTAPGSPSAHSEAVSMDISDKEDNKADDTFKVPEEEIHRRPPKRARRGTPPPREVTSVPSNNTAATARKDKVCLLLRAAQRTLGTAVARKTTRTFEPFGVKLPSEVDEKIDFDHWSPAKMFAQDLANKVQT